MLNTSPSCDYLVEGVRRSVTKLLAAELELGHLVSRLGIEHVDALARVVGVRRSVLIAAAMRASGLVRRHRPLERGAAARAKKVALHGHNSHVLKEWGG